MVVFSRNFSFGCNDVKACFSLGYCQCFISTDLTRVFSLRRVYLESAASLLTTDPPLGLLQLSIIP